jgi:hypothetical protein
MTTKTKPHTGVLQKGHNVIYFWLFTANQFLKKRERKRGVPVRSTLAGQFSLLSAGRVSEKLSA